MKRALALAAAMATLSLVGAGCAAKNDAPPPSVKTSYPSPDYQPQTEQAPPVANPQSVAPPAGRPLYSAADQANTPTQPAPPVSPPASMPAADAPRPMAGTPGMRPSGGQGRPGGPMLSRLFDVMDVDHNGRVTLEEWQAFHEKEFRRMDKNHDGVLTRDEMTNPPPLPGRGPRPAP